MRCRRSRRWEKTDENKEKDRNIVKDKQVKEKRAKKK